MNIVTYIHVTTEGVGDYGVLEQVDITTGRYKVPRTISPHSTINMLPGDGRSNITHFIRCTVHIRCGGYGDGKLECYHMDEKLKFRIYSRLLYMYIRASGWGCLIVEMSPDAEYPSRQFYSCVLYRTYKSNKHMADRKITTPPSLPCSWIGLDCIFFFSLTFWRLRSSYIHSESTDGACRQQLVSVFWVHNQR